MIGSMNPGEGGAPARALADPFFLCRGVRGMSKETAIRLHHGNLPKKDLTSFECSLSTFGDTDQRAVLVTCFKPRNQIIKIVPKQGRHIDDVDMHE